MVLHEEYRRARCCNEHEAHDRSDVAPIVPLEDPIVLGYLLIRPACGSGNEKIKSWGGIHTSAILMGVTTRSMEEKQSHTMTVALVVAAVIAAIVAIVMMMRR